MEHVQTSGNYFGVTSQKNYEKLEFTNLVSQNPEEFSRIISELRNAVFNIEETLEEFNGIRLDSTLQLSIQIFRTKLNKYMLIRSDCSWRRYDPELANALNSIDMCYGVLMNNESYSVGNIVYVAQMLNHVKDVFENKIEEYRSYIL